jgi:hypothetical protein
VVEGFPADFVHLGDVGTEVEPDAQGPPGRRRAGQRPRRGGPGQRRGRHPGRGRPARGGPEACPVGPTAAAAGPTAGTRAGRGGSAVRRGSWQLPSGRCRSRGPVFSWALLLGEVIHPLELKLPTVADDA